MLVVSCGSDPGSSSGSATEARWLASVLKSDRGSDGWPLPPGTWLTSAFGQTVSFETTTDLVLVAEDDQLVYLATPSSRNLIMIAKMSGMWNGTADVPVPEETDLMTAAWADNPANSIEASGELDATIAVPWWDIVITEMDDFVYPCWLGLDCAFSTFGGDSKVHSLQGERMRSYARNDLIVGLGVHAAGHAAGLDAAISVADSVAASLRFATDEQPEEPQQRFLATMPGAGLPSGPVVVPVDEHAVEIDLSDPQPLVAWFSDLGGFELSRDNSSLIVAELIPIDPTIPPTFCPPSPVGPPSGKPAYVDAEAASTPDSFEEYLDTFIEVTDTGTTELLGSPATWWQLGEPNAEQTNECLGENGFESVTFFLATQEGGVPLVAGHDDVVRVHFLHDSGLVLIAIAEQSTTDPLEPYEDVLATMRVLGP